MLFTGTLTIGRPIVAGCLVTQNEDHLIQIAASIENNSRHPIAYAILQEAQKRNLDLIKSINTKSFNTIFSNDIDLISASNLLKTTQRLEYVRTSKPHYAIMQDLLKFCF